MLLAVIAGAIVLYLIGWVLWIALQHKKFDHLPGPKRSSFFFGNLGLLVTSIRRTGNIGTVLLELMLAHGDVFIIWRLTEPTIVTSDLPIVKEFYTNLQLFKKPKESLIDKVGQTNLLGNQSIITDEGGSNWERKKRILDPGFKLSRLQDHISKFYRIGEQVADDLQTEQLRNGFVDFAKVIAPYTVHAISSAGFGVTEEKKLKELSVGTSEIGDYFANRFASRNLLRRTKLAVMLKFESPNRSEAENQLKKIRELGKRLIMDRVESQHFGKANDVLDFVIRANEDNGKFEMERCLEDFLAMYSAGNSTTSTTLGYFIAEMIRNVSILDKLIKEVDEIWVGREISRNSSNEEIAAALKDMVYLDAVLTETLRRHPPVALGIRTLLQDMKMSNYDVPAGASVMVSQHVLHHHPQYWNNPDTFNPDRFLGNKKPVPFSFAPFILGPRTCLGKNFALLEMKVFISIWLSRLTFEKLPDCKEEIITQQGALVKVLENRVIVRTRN